MDVPHRGTNLRSRFFFLFLWPSHKSPYRFEDPSCAFGAALLQGPTQLACWTFSCPMRQFLNAFPLREGGRPKAGMDVPHRGTNLRSRFFFLFLWPSHKSPYRFEDPSCAFGAALLQGPTCWGLSHMSFHAAATNCASLRHSVPRLWRGPSPRAYSLGTIRHWLSYRRRLTICLLFSQSLRRCTGGLPQGRF